MDHTNPTVIPSGNTQSGASVPISLPLSAHLSHGSDGSEGTPGIVPNLSHSSGYP